jgi:hypothetical protein
VTGQDEKQPFENLDSTTTSPTLSRLIFGKFVTMINQTNGVDPFDDYFHHETDGFLQ